MKSLVVFSPFVQGYILLIMSFVGLVMGSFLNVVSLRLFSEESIIFPGSKCPKCGKSIAWYDNIPLLSYFLLQGKCRHCKKSISMQYPLVEAGTALWFMGIIYTFGFTLKSLFLIILIGGLIVITITDIKEKVIFDIVSIPLIPLGLIYNFFDIGNSGLGVDKIHLAGINFTFTLHEVFLSAVLGALIGVVFFEGFSRLGLVMVGEYAFGSGDSIIGAALGAWFGWKMMIVILIVSFIFQLIIGFPIIIMNMYKDKDYKSIVFMFLLLVSVFIPYMGKELGWTQDLLGTIIVTIVAATIAIYGLNVVLESSKRRKSFTFMPFGPALVFGGLVAMFWGDHVLSWYLNLILH